MRSLILLAFFLVSCVEVVEVKVPVVEEVPVQAPVTDVSGLYSGTVFAEAKNCDDEVREFIDLDFHLIQDNNITAASFTTMLLEGTSSDNSFQVSDTWVVVDNTDRHNLHVAVLIATEIERDRAHLEYISTFSWGDDGETCTILYTGFVSRRKELDG